MKLSGKCLITFWVSVFFSFSLLAGERQVSIIPVPSSVVPGEGEYLLRSGKVACVPFNDELKGIVRYLNHKIEPASGISFTPVASGKTPVRLELLADQGLGKEAFRRKKRNCDRCGSSCRIVLWRAVFVTIVAARSEKPGEGRAGGVDGSLCGS